MKNFKKTILTAAMLVSAFNLIPANIMHISAVDFKMPADKGDVNNDTLVDAIDASLVLADYAFVSIGNESSFDEKQSYSADVNEDDKIDAIDASLILAHYAFIATGGENNDTPTVITTTPVTTTVPVTTTTAQTTTTQTSIEPDYDYKLEDIANDGAAFCQFSHKLNGDLLRGNGIGLTYGVTYGGLESKIVLAILNHGAISDEVIKDVFNCYTKDEIRNGIEFIYSIQKIEDFYGTRIDYSEYTIDKEIGTYINKISDAKKMDILDEFVLKTLTPNAVPTKITDHIAIKAMLATYDNQYMSKEIANEIGVDEFANNITMIALGESYTR